MKYPKIHHNVYVIELNPDVLKDQRFIAENPDLNPSLPCYYVGITGLTPEERFRNHNEGYKASRIAKRYSRCLAPDLYKEYNPMSYEDAQIQETTIAEKLRRRGHGVWQR